MTLAGTVLSGRYVLDEQIGNGGYGEVWRATDTSAGAAGAVSVAVPSGPLPAGATLGQPREPGARGLEHVRFRRHPVVVGRRDERRGVLHLDDDDHLDPP